MLGYKRVMLLIYCDLQLFFGVISVLMLLHCAVVTKMIYCMLSGGGRGRGRWQYSRGPRGRGGRGYRRY